MKWYCYKLVQTTVETNRAVSKVKGNKHKLCLHLLGQAESVDAAKQMAANYCRNKLRWEGSTAGVPGLYHGYEVPKQRSANDAAHFVLSDCALREKTDYAK